MVQHNGISQNACARLQIATAALTERMPSDRRSRMRRTSTGKQISITARDIDLFRTLARYRFLRSTYLHAFVGGASETRFKERLGNLFHEGFLDRPAEQWKFATCRCRPVVHELGRGGRAVLSNLGEAVTDQRTCLNPGPQRQLQHSLMICEILASIELAIRQRPDLRFIAWPEIQDKAPGQAQRENSLPRLELETGSYRQKRVAGALIPDAVFGIQYSVGDRRLYRFFALEADRGTMPIARANEKQASLLSKIAMYKQALAQNRPRLDLGVPNLLVLVVTPSQQRTQNILSCLDDKRFVDPAILVRSVATSTMTGPHSLLLTELWARVGCLPMTIADAA